MASNMDSARALPIGLRPPGSMRQLSWFLAKFCGIFFACEYAYFKIPDTYLREVVYHQLLVRPCVALINFISPGEHIIAQQNFLVSATANLEIVRGCDGAGTIFLMAAAILAYSCSIKDKLQGLFCAVLALALLNYLRIAGLYFLAALANHWFELVHVYLAPTLIILLGCVFFAYWAPAPRIQT